MSGYIGNGPGRGQRQAFSFTATASQTTFSGVDSIGLTLTYKPGFIDVYVNGLCIPPSEYTATNGSSIVFGFGLNASDVVYVVAMSAFDVANTLALDQNGADILNKAAFLANLGVTPGHLLGEPSNGNSAAGEVGEYVSSTVLVGSSIALTTNTQTNVTSITLTPGDWDVSGVVYINPAATTNVTRWTASISTTSATLDGTPGRFSNTIVTGGTTPGNVLTESIIPTRMSLSANTTVYLIAYSTFTVSTNSAFGIIRARRVR